MILLSCFNEREGLRIDPNHPMHASIETIRQHWKRMQDAEPRSFLGVIGPDGTTLQFYWDPAGQILADQPHPNLNGSYQLAVSLSQATTILERFCCRGEPPSLPDAEFVAW
ncbi:MAG: hypothetical protein AAGD07_06750 [Planctomycetota bacterium]